MAFTLAGFYENINASAALSEINTIEDTHLTVSGKDLTVPVLNKVLKLFVMGNGLTAARLSSPSLRRLWLFDFPALYPNSSLPNDQAVDEGGSGAYTIYRNVPIVDLAENPLELVSSEKLNFLVKNGGAADTYGLVWLGDVIPRKVTGKIFSVKATASKTLTPKKWTASPIDFEQELPAGRYQVVGMRVKSANIIAARLLFVGQVWRPGVLGVRTLDEVYDEQFRMGNMGVFGEFEFDQPPQVEFLASASDTSEEVYLDLIQVRAGR